MSSRKEAAEKIKAHPKKYKVCEGCGSIVVKKTTVCPNCNAYRFECSVECVIEQAEALASRDPQSIEHQDYL